MGRWVDGRMDGWRKERMDGQIDAWINGEWLVVSKKMDGYIDRWMRGWMRYVRS